MMEIVKDAFINHEFVEVHPKDGEIARENPAQKDDLIGAFPYAVTSVGQSVDAAHRAFATWSCEPLPQRLSILEQWAKIIAKHEETLALALTREIGKPLWEAKTEVKNVLNKFSVTRQLAMPRVEPFLVPTPSESVRAHCRFKPRGVLAVIAPFNFPLHLAMGHIVPALACGNTVVLKPSELAPGISSLLALTAHEAQLPKGVFNLVQGEALVGEALCQHPFVSGILFTGSYAVGQQILKSVSQDHTKIVVLEMGGKNTSVIWEDAHLSQAAKMVLQSAMITAGQRCTSTAKLLIHEKVFREVLELLRTTGLQIKTAMPLSTHTFMGPLISEKSQQRFQTYQEALKHLHVRNLLQDYPEVPTCGYFVKPSIHVVEDFSTTTPFADEELFGPDLTCYRVHSLSQAMEAIEKSRYGLASSIFTGSRNTYEAFLQGITAGVVNWNRPTTGASSSLPFGGQKASGNHFPTALFAPYYCTYPVASLEALTPEVEPFPGFPLG